MPNLESIIRNITDWPKAGIQFKDITPLMADPVALARAIDELAAPFTDLGIDLVLGTEARGFLFAPALALRLKAGVAIARKPGKLPWNTIRQEYALEYGTDSLELHTDAIKPGQRVLLVDDLLATGGTITAAAELVRRLGGIVAGYAFLIELGFLPGRSRLTDAPVHSLICYQAE
jgi:adenine phosphoribosyltransferase